MPIDISAQGLRIVLNASVTFPQGIVLTQFPDDVDAFDSPSQQLKDKATGLNGDLVTWSKSNHVPLTINVLPNTDDDRNLQVLARVNRSAKGRRPVNDVITVTILYASGESTRYVRGALTDAPLSDGVASSGRRKSKAYQFAFEDIV